MNQLPARQILAGVFIASLLPFLIVGLFPSQLDKVMDRSSYLVFHNVAEFFSIMVSLCVFSVGWYTYDQSKDQRALLLGTAFLCVGLLDFMHTLGNAAMPDFITPNSTNKSTQFWITARFLDASAILASAFVNPGRQIRWVSKMSMMTAALSVTGLVFTTVTFFPDYLPATAVQGVGLTPLKRYLEFLVIILLATATVVYWKRMARTGDRLLIYFLAAFIICIFGEACFASYKTGFDTYNVLGHIYKVVAFYLIYKGIFASAVRKPYEYLSAANEKLRMEIVERQRTMEALREKEQMVIHQSRLAAMGEMIGNIAHQWRQPLNNLGLIIQQLRLYYDHGELSRDFLDKNVDRSMDIINHMSSTIDDFRNYFKPDKERVEFKVHESVAKTLSLMEGSFSSQQIGIAVDVKDDPVIYGYPNEFSQVLLNILTNARDVLTEQKVDGPRIMISLGTVENRAVVTIADNAGGIPEEIIGRIFDPYFTTKGSQAGTGVGLFMSKTIIEKNMGGRLAARNTADGAEFRIEV